MIFKAEIELFHNDFPYPEPYIYSNDLCLRFLTGEIFSKVGYGVECKTNILDKRVFDITLGKNYELDIGIYINVKHNKIRFVGKDARIQKFIKNQLKPPN